MFFLSSKSEYLNVSEFIMFLKNIFNYFFTIFVHEYLTKRLKLLFNSAFFWKLSFKKKKKRYPLSKEPYKTAFSVFLMLFLATVVPPI